MEGKEAWEQESYLSWFQNERIYWSEEENYRALNSVRNERTWTNTGAPTSPQTQGSQSSMPVAGSAQCTMRHSPAAWRADAPLPAWASPVTNHKGWQIRMERPVLPNSGRVCVIKSDSHRPGAVCFWYQNRTPGPVAEDRGCRWSTASLASVCGTVLCGGTVLCRGTVLCGETLIPSVTFYPLQHPPIQLPIQTWRLC